MNQELIGRTTEVEAVDRLLTRASGGLSTLLIQGDAGIGKTAIWREGVERGQQHGFRVLRATPAESERTLSLGVLTDLLASITEAELGALPAVQRHALEIAILRAEPTGQLPDQRTISVAAATLLRELLDATPVLIAIDDAQWADDASAAILAYAIRRLVDRPAGVLLAVRGEPPAPVLELASGVPVDRRERQPLGRLPLAALHQLFLARTGRSFPRLTLVRIEQASGGNPFYALEIARALSQPGAVVTPGEPLPIPDTLGALVEARIGDLPTDTRAALLLAAVAAEPSLETLGRANPDAPRGLDPALAAGIVAVDGHSVRFSHPLLAEAVVALAGPDELRRVHATLARTATSDDIRARHLAGATEGPDEDVAAALEAAAAQSRDRGATLDASSLYERSSALTPESLRDAAIRRAILAAECLFIDVSENVQADRILATAIATAPSGPTRAEALSLRAIIRYYHGQTPDAVRLGLQALDEVGSDPILRARVLARTAFLVMQVDLARGNGLAAEAIKLLEPANARSKVDPDLLANVLLLHASSELGLVRGLLTDEIERGRGLISEAGRSWEHDGAEGIDYGLARQLDDVDRAIEMTEQLIRVKSGPGGDDPFNLVSLSGLQVFRGDWAAARLSAEAADEGYAHEGADVFPSWRLRGLALVAAHDGRVAAAREWATDGLALAQASGDLALEVYHRQILGFVALSTGDILEADAQLTAAERAATASGTLHPGRFKIDGDRLEAALAAGDTERAGTILDGLEHAAEVAPTPWTLAIAARGRGLVEAAMGDNDRALVSLEGALVAHDNLPMPFERARTILALGQVHRRRKEKRLADERLREALGIFESLGAPTWVDRALRELGRVGLRPRASDDLTETERHVAQLAATGMSSRQIAEQAFLSPKTVGNVLGRVYGKLGIHSRAELGALMGEGQERDRSG